MLFIELCNNFDYYCCFISFLDVSKVALDFSCLLNLQNPASQLQMCEEPFKATITLATKVTFPISASHFDPDLVHFRKILCFTEE